MRHIMTRLFISFALIVSLAGPAATVKAAPGERLREETPDFADGEAIVTLSGSGAEALASPGSYSADHEVEIENTWDFGGICIVEVSSDDLTTEQLVENLAGEEHVVAAEPNYYRRKLSTNDNLRPYQWYLNGYGSFHSSSLGVREDSLSSPVTGDKAPIAAIVDTGIDYTHEDLKDHMWKNPYPSLPGIYGYDFGDIDSDPMDEDDDGHGTHCAGIISAVRDNECGIAGISGARLMALKIFDREGVATDSNIIAAFNYIYQAQSLGADIAAINCSWGGGGPTPEYEKILIDKLGQNGSLFIFAAGNESENHDLPGGTDFCPYDIKEDYVIKVGASDRSDKPAGFSDYGKNTVDLFAPGETIVSTVNSESFVPFLYTQEQREKLCSFYSSFDRDDTVLYTAADIGRSSKNLTYGEKTLSSDDYFGGENSGSLSVPVRVSDSEAVCELYLDVSNLHLNPRNYYYVSYELGIEENGAILWEHNYILRDSKSFVTYQGHTYLRIVALQGDFREIPRIYIDNAAVSSAVDNVTSFGKYNVLSGTSMAAPSVTAAVVLLAGMHPSDTPAQRKSRLLHCIRPASSLSAFCRTGGILDFSRLLTASYDVSLDPSGTSQKPTVSADNKTTEKKIPVKKITLNKKKASLRYGKKLKLKASVTPKNATNKKITWTVSKKKYASVSKKGIVKAKKKGIGHSIKVYARAKDGSGKKAVCTVKIKRKK